MDKKYFLTGIGTSVGKTIVAAALTKLWDACYWKPIQSGDLDNTDSMTVRQLLGDQVRIFPERYKLITPASPHYAASLDGIAMKVADFQLPNPAGNLIVEGAGGLHVPINEDELIIDLIEHLSLETIIVCSDYLGSINHSLLSFESLANRGIPVAYIVLNGDFNESTRRILTARKPAEAEIITIPHLTSVDAFGLQHALQELKIEH